MHRITITLEPSVALFYTRIALSSGRTIWLHTWSASPDPFKPGNTMRATAEPTRHSAISHASTFFRLTYK